MPFTVTNFHVPGTPVCSLADGGTANPAGACSHLLALASSSSAPGALGPHNTAWIGFSDGTIGGDSDYQDMVVKIQDAPATLAVLGVGLLGTFLARKRRSAAPEVSPGLNSLYSASEN
jgi:hypothetical protein